MDSARFITATRVSQENRSSTDPVVQGRRWVPDGSPLPPCQLHWSASIAEDHHEIVAATESLSRGNTEGNRARRGVFPFSAKGRRQSDSRQPVFSRLSRPLLEGQFADELAPLQPTPGSSMNSTGRASWRLQNAFWRVPLTCGCRRHSKALTETDVVRPFRISHRGGAEDPDRSVSVRQPVLAQAVDRQPCRRGLDTGRRT